MRGEATHRVRSGSQPRTPRRWLGAPSNPWPGKDQVLTGMAYGIHANWPKMEMLPSGRTCITRRLDRELRRMAPQSFRSRRQFLRATSTALLYATGGRVSSVGRSVLRRRRPEGRAHHRIASCCGKEAGHFCRAICRRSHEAGDIIWLARVDR